VISRCLLPRYRLSGSLKKHYQQAERLLLQPEEFRLLGELAAVHICFKAAEVQTSRQLLGLIYKTGPLRHQVQVAEAAAALLKRGVRTLRTGS
jgi:hypothetical protein